MIAMRNLASAVRGGRARPPTFCLHRHMSESSQPTENIEVDIDRSSGIVKMALNRRPANAMSFQFMTDICKTIDRLEADSDCRGLILTSKIPGMFGAGLDLPELRKPDKEKFRAFWRALQDTWIKLYTTRLATVAAVNGHAIAGGCLLAVACDYRIMVSEAKFLIGLNETRVGLPMPFWLSDGTVATVGKRRADQIMQLGSLISPQEALNIGLVDELLTTDSDLQDKATGKLQKFLSVPDYTRQLTKAYLKEDALERFLARRDEDVELYTKVVCEDSRMQNILEEVLASFGSKKKK